MTTKNDCLFLKDKQNFSVNDISDYGNNNHGQYSNLHLNQNHIGLIPVQPCTKPSKDKDYATCKSPDSTVSENYEGKGMLKAWKKPITLKLGDGIQEKAEKQTAFSLTEEKGNASNSTLSLHIAAFENSVEAVSTDTIKKWGNKKEVLVASRFVIQNLFEFPRQQNDKVEEPEVSKFKASQKLSDPNEASINGEQKQQIASDRVLQKSPTQVSTMKQQAFEFLEQKIKFVYSVLTDIGSIKTFDYEAFISYVTWSTMISVIRYVSASQAASPIGLYLLSHMVSLTTAFHLLYVYLPFLALFAATYDIENASLTDRRIILSFTFIIFGLMAGYYYPQKFNHGSGDFFLPLISNFLFYFLAQNLKENRLLLLGICVSVPASMSVYYAYIFDSFSFLFFINLFQSSFYIYFCLQLAIRAYSEIGAKSERDIFRMVIQIAVVSQFLGSLSFLASFATS